MRLRRNALMIALAALTSLSCAATTARAPVLTPGGVRFTVANDDARSVAVAGTFNGWSVSAHPLTRSGSGTLWTAVIALPAGEHRFMFVVNGTEWLEPPLADDFVDDGFGSKNGVVIVRPDER